MYPAFGWYYVGARLHGAFWGVLSTEGQVAVLWSPGVPPLPSCPMRCHPWPRTPPERSVVRVEQMFGSILRKCRRCGHRVRLYDTTRAEWDGHSTWVCSDCYRELVKQATGYDQPLLPGMPEREKVDEPLPF